MELNGRRRRSTCASRPDIAIVPAQRRVDGVGAGRHRGDVAPSRSIATIRKGAATATASLHGARGLARRARHARR